MTLSKKELGSLIKRARQEKAKKDGAKYSQSDLAIAVKKSRSYIGDLESGRTYPSYPLLSRIAEACEVPLSFFNTDIDSFIDSQFDEYPQQLLDELKRAIKENESLKLNFLEGGKDGIKINGFKKKKELNGDSNIIPIPLSTCVIRIPILGSIPAGLAVEAVQDIIGWEEIPEEWGRGDRQYFGLSVKGDSMYPEYLPGDVVIVRMQSYCDSGDDCAVMVNNTDATLKRVHLHEDGIELEAVNPMYGKKFFNEKEVKSLPVSILGVVVELRRKRK